MTHELGPDARALLDAAREGIGPDADAIRRMRAKIDASIAGGVAGAAGAAGAGAGAGMSGAMNAAGGGAGGGAGASAGIGGGGALAAKLGIAALAAALVAGALVLGLRGEESIEPRAQLHGSAVEPRVEQAASREPAAPAAPAPDPEIEMAPVPIVRDPASPAGASPASPASPAAPPASPARSGESSAAAPQAAPQLPQTPPAPPASPRRADLAREVELVDQAMAALRRGDPTAALAAVRVHVDETAGAGQLAEDAAAIEVEALCRLKAPNVAAKLAAFDAKWPESAQRSRLSTRCP